VRFSQQALQVKIKRKTIGASIFSLAAVFTRVTFYRIIRTALFAANIGRQFLRERKLNI
jgi:hypothetical protein